MPKKKQRETYSKRPCSTKPTLEQEKQIEQIVQEDNLTRSDIMRDALVDYLMQKRLLRIGKESRKDPVRLMHEKILREQIDPLRQQVEEIADVLKGVTRMFTNLDGRIALTTASTPSMEATNQFHNPLSIKSENAYKLLEQVYICVLLNQLLLSNFLAEPFLQTAHSSGSEDAAVSEAVLEHLQLKEKGWSKITVQAVDLIRRQAETLSAFVINDIEEETKVKHCEQPLKTAAVEIPAAEEIIAIT